MLNTYNIPGDEEEDEDLMGKQRDKEEIEGLIFDQYRDDDEDND